MDPLVIESCCACLLAANPTTMYWLGDLNTLQLFKESTSISIPDDDQHLSQYICALCYKQCDLWQCFKSRCQESYKRSSPGRLVTEAPVQECDVYPPVDSMVVKVEPMDQYEVTGFHIHSDVKVEAPEGVIVVASEIDPRDESDEEENEDLPAVNQPIQPNEPSQSGRKKLDSIRATNLKIIKRYTKIAPKVQPKVQSPTQSLSHSRYIRTYDEFIRWKERTEAEEINEDTLIEYFKNFTGQNACLQFALLKVPLLALLNINIDSYGALKKYITDSAVHKKTKLDRAQLMTFFSKNQHDPDIYKLVIVCLWISGVKTNDLWGLLIDHVNDEGTQIKVTFGSHRYYIIPFPGFNYNPLPLLRIYLEIVRRSATSQNLIQRVLGGKVTLGTLGRPWVQQLPKQVAAYLKLPNSVDQPDGHKYNSLHLIDYEGGMIPHALTPDGKEGRILVADKVIKSLEKCLDDGECKDRTSVTGGVQRRR